MSSETLDQMLSFVPQSSQKLYNTIDVYAIGTTAFYSGPAFDPSKFSKFGEFGSNGFRAGTYGNLWTGHNLGSITGDSNLDPYNLTERYDLGGHKDKQGNETAGPHMNQNVNDETKQHNGDPRDIIGGGSTNKTTNRFGAPITDGYKGFGPNHHIDLDL